MCMLQNGCTNNRRVRKCEDMVDQVMGLTNTEETKEDKEKAKKETGL